MKKTETEKTSTRTMAQGKYANLLKQGSNVVILDAALLPFFPDSESVNRALRAFLAINDQVQSAGTRVRGRRRPGGGLVGEFDPRAGVEGQSVSR